MSQKVGSHFATVEHVKNLVVILLTLNKPKHLIVILLTLNELGMAASWLSCQTLSKPFRGQFLLICYRCSCILKNVFSNRPARIRKNKNKQTIFNIVFTLLV